MKRPDNTSSELVLRFGADRVCAWRICGDRACLRARACRGDVLRCADLMGGWLEAIEEEQRARGDLAALEDSLNTIEEVRVYRAWRKALYRTKMQSGDEAAEVERLRQNLLRRFNACNGRPNKSGNRKSSVPQKEHPTPLPSGERAPAEALRKRAGEGA
jgi:hypothetical protein